MADAPCNVTLMSFGFKYGPPAANYFFDVGFVKNPARNPEWGFFSSPDEEMRAFVMEQEPARNFVDRVVPLIEFLSTVDQHQILAFGCSAGRHRSPLLVKEISRRLKERGIDNRVVHRDGDK